MAGLSLIMKKPGIEFESVFLASSKVNYDEYLGRKIG